MIASVATAVCKVRYLLLPWLTCTILGWSLYPGFYHRKEQRICRSESRQHVQSTHAPSPHYEAEEAAWVSQANSQHLSCCYVRNFWIFCSNFQLISFRYSGMRSVGSARLSKEQIIAQVDWANMGGESD
jgi:hypothetical protein